MIHTHTTDIHHHTLWKVLIVALLGGILGFFLPSLFRYRVDAESCTGNSGNLEGYIQTQNLGKIYVSKESWDNDHPGNPSDTDFYVRYDTEQGIWSGKGFNEQVGWVDFDYNQQGRKARFVAPNEEYDRLHDSDSNNDEPVRWGNWRGVADLSNVEYDVQHAKFVGTGIDKDPHTGGGDPDEVVGSGKWNFDNVALIKSSCPEQINLFFNVNGILRNSYHKSTCPIAEEELTLQWTSEGVHDCESIAGPWDLIARPDENTGTSVHNTSDIDGVAYFKLKCIGDYTGNDVIRTAKASCGESTGGTGGQCEGNDCPIIAPKLIEA